MSNFVTRKELAAKYGVSLVTFAKYLKSIPNLTIKNNNRITPSQLKIIVNYLGEA